jgi:hypothetical protein
LLHSWLGCALAAFAAALRKSVPLPVLMELLDGMDKTGIH